MSNAMPMDYTIDGEKVRVRRSQLGLTQGDVFKLTDIHMSRLSRIEHGHETIGDHEQARSLAAALQCTLEDLMVTEAVSTLDAIAGTS